MTSDATGGRAASWLRATSYWPVLSHPVMRRLLPGYALSALGDGMSMVAVSWLAVRLAPPSQQGLWVGAALAAYTLPGALGMVLLGRWLRGRRGVRLAGADAVLRAVALAAAGVLAALHQLPVPLYVGLLAMSSLLHAWGTAGQYTLVGQILPARQRLAGNGLLAVIANTALIAGPALAGVVTALAGPAIVIVADAATWAVLAVSYAWAAPLVPGPPRAARAAEAAGRSPSGWQVIRASRALAGLLTLTVIFYFLYGPVEVALPVYVASDLHRSAALLGGFWTAYAVGAVLGSFAAPLLRHLPVWPVMIGIVAGWGLALLPVGLGAPLTVSLAAFALGGVIYAPYTSVSMAVFQDASPAGAMVAVLATRSAWAIVSSPLGSAFGGPLVTVLGAQETLLASALTTIAVALVAAGLASRRALVTRRAGRTDTPAR